MSEPQFPARWTKPHFKPAVRSTAKQQRRAKSRKVEQREAEQKGRVRKRDRYCRFPLCGCDAFKLARHVAHLEHKGMGGNPTGSRSKSEHMILVCSARHKESSISIDKGTVRVRELTRRGTEGPVAWDVLQAAGWFEVGRETSRHVCEPFTPEQRSLLLWLARARMLG